MDLKEVDILGDSIGSHWYYRSKTRALSRLLADFHPTTVLDVGAGSGFFSRYLLTHSGARKAWCVDPSYDAETDEVEGGKPIYFRRSVSTCDADLILLMDVLEHVDNDLALLTQYAALVRPGSRFLITVPAFPFLWSGHDDFLEHKRRYTLSELERVVSRAELSLKRSAYYFAFILPFAAPIRLVGRLCNSGARSDLRRQNFAVNKLLEAPLPG